MPATKQTVSLPTNLGHQLMPRDKGKARLAFWLTVISKRETLYYANHKAGLQLQSQIMYGYNY